MPNILSNEQVALLRAARELAHSRDDQLARHAEGKAFLHAVETLDAKEGLEPSNHWRTQFQRFMQATFHTSVEIIDPPREVLDMGKKLSADQQQKHHIVMFFALSGKSCVEVQAPKGKPRRVVGNCQGLLLTPAEARRLNIHVRALYDQRAEGQATDCLMAESPTPGANPTGEHTPTPQSQGLIPRPPDAQGNLSHDDDVIEAVEVEVEVEEDPEPQLELIDDFDL